MRGLVVAVSICLSLWTGLSLGLAVGRAQSDDLESRVRVYLASGVEQSVTPQTLARLGPALPDALLAIFERTSEPRYVRLRALSMLAQLQHSRVKQLFVRLLHEGVQPVPTQASDALHPSRSALVLRRVIESVSGDADHKLAPLEADLTRALQHHNAQVRRAAVQALQQLTGARVRQTLAAQLARETSPLVRRALTDRSVRSQAPRPIVPKSATPPR